MITDNAPIDIYKYTVNGLRWVKMTEEDFNTFIADTVMSAQKLQKSELDVYRGIAKLVTNPEIQELLEIEGKTIDYKAVLECIKGLKEEKSFLTELRTYDATPTLDVDSDQRKKSTTSVEQYIPETPDDLVTPVFAKLTISELSVQRATQILDAIWEYTLYLPDQLLDATDTYYNDRRLLKYLVGKKVELTVSVKALK